MSAKRFAHYSLEGLLRQGPHEVWVTLGRYTTVEQAEEVVRKRAAREGIVATRVLPCYRQTPEGTAERGTGFTVA